MGERGFLGMACGEMTGIDFYLGDMERKAEEREALWEKIGGIKGLKRLFKG